MKVIKTYFRARKMFLLLQQKAEIMSSPGGFSPDCWGERRNKRQGLLGVCLFQRRRLQTSSSLFLLLTLPLCWESLTGGKFTQRQLDWGDSEGSRCLFIQRHLKSLHSSLEHLTIAQTISPCRQLHAFAGSAVTFLSGCCICVSSIYKQGTEHGRSGMTHPDRKASLRLTRDVIQGLLSKRSNHTRSFWL